jgi:hypothetical protein
VYTSDGFIHAIYEFDGIIMADLALRLKSLSV